MWEKDKQMTILKNSPISIYISLKKKPVSLKSPTYLHGHTLDDLWNGKYIWITINNDLSWHDL